MPILANDEMAIRQLMARYCFNLDNREFRELAALFTADGVWETSYGTAKGPAEIEALLAKLVPVEPRRRHFLSNLIVEEDGRVVRCVSYYLVFLEASDGPRPAVAGTYFDEVEEGADGVWRFRRRRLQQDIVGDMGLASDDD